VSVTAAPATRHQSAVVNIAPTLFYTGQVLDTPVLPGFTITVEEALGN